MPRRKRKNRKNIKKSNKPEIMAPRVDSELLADEMRTCIENNSQNSSGLKTTSLILPVCTPSPVLRRSNSVNARTDSSALLRTRSNSYVRSSPLSTPVNRSRACGPHGTSLHLNFSSLSDGLLKIGSAGAKIRSYSSIPKLHSPGIERIPITSNVSTQTELLEDSVSDSIKSCAEITETPKINQALLLDLDYDIDISSTPGSAYKTPLKRMRKDSLTPIYDVQKSDFNAEQNLHDLNNFQNIKSASAMNYSKILPLQNVKRNSQHFNDILFNSSHIIDLENEPSPHAARDNKKAKLSPNVSDTEISFFTPHLYNFKSASTPVEKAPENAVTKATNNLAVDDDKSKHTRGHTDKIPSFIHNSSFADLRNEDKCKKFVSTKVVKRDLFSLAKIRSYRSLTPKVSRNVSCVKLCNKDVSTVKNVSPRKIEKPLSPSRRFSSEQVGNFLNVANTGLYGKVFSRIRKFHGKISTSLSAKIIEICSWLGIKIKKGLSSIYRLYSLEKSIIENTINSSKTASCICRAYKFEISALTAKIDTISTEMGHLKKEMEAHKEDKAKLSAELIQMKQEITHFDSIWEELDTIKKQLTSNNLSAPATIPPPPPPPPLPLIPISCTPTSRPLRTIGRKLDRNNENSRPVISLDDILKVKLKKISDKPSSALTKRTSQPIVSMDMLRQVKLRPASRPSTPQSTSDSSPATGSGSPHSNLTRILSNVDTNVLRVKRLRRVGGYSFDDISRRSHLMRRERERFGSESGGAV